MTTSRKTYVLLAAGGSAAMLFGAMVVFQRLMDLPPCAMCIWQRWPHAAAVAIGLLALLIKVRLVPALGALAALTTGAIGVFHFGVEHKYWEGPASCTGSGLSGMNVNDLLAVDSGPKLVMCDQISWELLGISMPGWNAIISFILAFIWIKAVLASRPTAG